MADNEIPKIPLLNIETATVREMAECINGLLTLMGMHTKTLEMAAKAVQKSGQLLEKHEKILGTLVREGRIDESEDGDRTLQ